MRFIRTGVTKATKYRSDRQGVPGGEKMIMHSVEVSRRFNVELGRKMYSPN
jgi:hypothetical protein